MPDVRTAPVPAPSSVRPSTGGPVPRRLRPPGWLDLRLVLGVLLVLGSVLLGARAVDGADETVQVWSASTDLAAGSRLSADDLVVVDVRLDEAAGRYLAGSTRPEGRVLARAVGAGELVPRSAVTEASGMVRLALPVQARYAPPDLARGQVVDIYGIDESAADVPPGTVAPVATAVTVQDVSGRSDGGLSGASAELKVVISVTVGSAPSVLAAVAGRPLVVVVRDGVDVAAAPGSEPIPVPDPTPTPEPTPEPTPGPSPGPVPATPPAPTEPPNR